MRFSQRSEKLPEQKTPQKILETEQYANSRSHFSLPYHQKPPALHRRLRKPATTNDNPRQHDNHRKKPMGLQTKETRNLRTQQSLSSQRKRPRKLHNHRMPKRTPTTTTLHIQQRKPT